MLRGLPAFLCQQWGWCVAVFSPVTEVPLLLPHAAAAAHMAPACKAACRSWQPWHGPSTAKRTPQAWEISKAAALYKPYFHLTSLNILWFQNTHLKITYRNIYMNTARNFPALEIQPTAHGRACDCHPVQPLHLLLSLSLWECLSLLFLKLILLHSTLPHGLGGLCFGEVKTDSAG